MAQIPSYPALAAVSDSDKFVAAVGTANKVYHVLGSTLKTYVNTSQLLYVDTTQVGTTAVVTEETLASYTLPANTLSVDGDYIEITATGSYAANTNLKTIKIKFGSTILDTTAININDYNWTAAGRIYRTAAATQKTESLIIASKASGIVLSSASLSYQEKASITEDLTAAIIISVTGQNGTANANDILLETFTVEQKKQ